VRLYKGGGNQGRAIKASEKLRKLSVFLLYDTATSKRREGRTQGRTKEKRTADLRGKKGNFLQFGAPGNNSQSRKEFR